MGVEARCPLSKSAAHCCQMKRQPFLHGCPCCGHLLCHRRCHLQLRLRCHCRCCCRHLCRRNRSSPLPLPWAIAAVAVNHFCRHLCCIAISHHCCHRPCCQTLPTPSLLAIAVAIAVSHHHCHAVSHFRELLPWRSKNCIWSIEAKNAYLIFVGTVGGVLIDGSLTRCQAATANTSIGRQAASSERLVRELAGGWGEAGSEGWRH